MVRRPALAPELRSYLDALREKIEDDLAVDYDLDDPVERRRAKQELVRRMQEQLEEEQDDRWVVQDAASLILGFLGGVALFGWAE